MKKPERGVKNGSEGLQLDGEHHWSISSGCRLTLARFASAEELGDFITLLVSDKQGGMGWMVGSDVVIDGGASRDTTAQLTF